MQIHVSRAELHFHRLTVFLNPDGDVPLQLKEELLRFVVMLVLASIRAGYDHDDVVTAFDVQVLVPNWRLEQVPVRIDPGR